MFSFLFAHLIHLLSVMYFVPLGIRMLESFAGSCESFFLLCESSLLHLKFSFDLIENSHKASDHRDVDYLVGIIK